MGKFISWIEKDEQVLFLTAEDIASSRGKETFRECRNNDLFGHEAIRQYFGANGEPFKGGADRENRDFWNGKLPKEIKKAWNNGQLDGTLDYLQRNDIIYILRKAPSEFAAWIIKCYFGNKDFEAMKKDDDWSTRLLGLAASQDFEAMKKDDDRYIRLFGLLASQDFEAMERPQIL